MQEFAFPLREDNVAVALQGRCRNAGREIEPSSHPGRYNFEKQPACEQD